MDKIPTFSSCLVPLRASLVLTQHALASFAPKIHLRSYENPYEKSLVAPSCVLLQLAHPFRVKLRAARIRRFNMRHATPHGLNKQKSSADWLYSMGSTYTQDACMILERSNAWAKILQQQQCSRSGQALAQLTTKLDKLQGRQLSDSSIKLFKCLQRSLSALTTSWHLRAEYVEMMYTAILIVRGFTSNILFHSTMMKSLHDTRARSVMAVGDALARGIDISRDFAHKSNQVFDDRRPASIRDTQQASHMVQCTH